MKIIRGFNIHSLLMGIALAALNHTVGPFVKKGLKKNNNKTNGYNSETLNQLFSEVRDERNQIKELITEISSLKDHLNKQEIEKENDPDSV